LSGIAGGKVILKFLNMPIFFQQDIDNDTRLAIWKIEESEEFFLQKAVPQRLVGHPHKRLQHLAGRYLLRHLFPEFPVELIRIADTRKPFLEDDAYHFSISHCGDFAAAIVSKTKRVGVDIEEVRPTVGKVQHKFVSEIELDVRKWELGKEQLEWVTEQLNEIQSSAGEVQSIVPDLELLTLIWSCKEAVYKWFGWGEVDFKEHIVFHKVKRLTDTLYHTTIHFQKAEPVMLQLHSRSFEGIVLSYVET
jgi:phosphopantetheinyl transferase